MASTLSPGEEAQLGQTIEMFEVITQSQPQDYQSLEILKEAYSKLNREKDVVNTSKRIAQAYVQMGQLSSAILEYESILQRYPDDPDVQAALQQIESKANTFPLDAMPAEPAGEQAAERADLQQRLTFTSRTYAQVQSTMRYACQVPATFDRRLGAYAHMLADAAR